MLTQNLLMIVVLLTILWIVSVYLRDVSIIDAFWGIGFVVVAWSTLACAPWSCHELVPWLLVWLTTIWGLRLSGHLTWRTFRGSRQAGGRHEDRRYAAMRARDERFWWTSLFKVFWLQAGILWFVSLPVQVGICPSPSLQFVALPDRLANTLIVLGSTIWAVGLFFEAIGDYQLARFVADRNNQGQVLSSGLWRYTRHPNYFGDFCVWWGLYLIALANGAWWTFVGPLAISFFLLRVSGVTLLERDIGNRRPGYREYVERTSAFFPRPPK